MNTVKLKSPAFNHRDDRFNQVDYSESAPFFINPRGVLAHRIRALFTLTAFGSTWTIAEYWCENNGRDHSGADECLAFDPGERLICSRCEANAVAKGEKTSSQLAGRHVCVGVVRPVNVCECPKGKRERN